LNKNCIAIFGILQKLGFEICRTFFFSFYYILFLPLDGIYLLLNILTDVARRRSFSFSIDPSTRGKFFFSPNKGRGEQHFDIKLIPPSDASAAVDSHGRCHQLSLFNIASASEQS
jgi:hypothetical protein